MSKLRVFDHPAFFGFVAIVDAEFDESTFDPKADELPPGYLFDLVGRGAQHYAERFVYLYNTYNVEQPSDQTETDKRLKQ